MDGKVATLPHRIRFRHRVGAHNEGVDQQKVNCKPIGYNRYKNFATLILVYTSSRFGLEICMTDYMVAELSLHTFVVVCTSDLGPPGIRLGSVPPTTSGQASVI